MILQTLKKFADDHAALLPSDGLQTQEIKFVIEIDETGTFKQLCDYRKDKRGKEYLLPQSVGRSGSASWQVTFLLWDHYGYVLGHPKDDSEKAVEMAMRQLSTFIKMLDDLPEELKQHQEISAMAEFYKRVEYKKVFLDPKWEECAKLPNCNLTFKLIDDTQLIPEKPFVHEYASQIFQNQVNTDEDAVDADDSRMEARCLITGEYGPIKKIHTATPIMGSKSNAKLLGFQVNSGYDSYGKVKAFNAPVSFKAESAYIKALKYLIKDAIHSIRIAETTIVFWTQQNSPQSSFNLESEFGWFFTDAPKDDPDRGVGAVKALYAAIHTGAIPENTGDRFFILGLSPNAARIAVRFWKQGTIKDTANHMKLHFDDFMIVHGPKEEEHLPLGKILRATALEYKLDNVPPSLAGDVVQAILDVTEYPQTLLQQCVRRIRAEQQVGRTRAAICKAVINRKIRRNQSLKTEKEITVALDTSNTNIGYVLGRLFAVLERCQEQAQGNLNASIRERYYGAFSSTPITVLPTLLKLNKHHLAKLAAGQKTWFDKQMGEVMAMVDAENIPANLRLPDQAKFAVGYYHQRQDFFKGKETETPEATK